MYESQNVLETVVSLLNSLKFVKFLYMYLLHTLSILFCCFLALKCLQMSSVSVSLGKRLSTAIDFRMQQIFSMNFESLAWSFFCKIIRLYKGI